MTRPDRGTILIVEDDEGIAALECRRLERAGYAVVTAATANEALGQLAAGEFDLLVLDHSLPGGASGLEFYTQLQAAGHNVPVIMVTGNSSEATVIQALRLGVADFVTKSLEYLDYLPEAVARVLARARTERQLEVSEQRFRTVFESAAVGMALLDANACLLSTNPALQGMLAADEDELRAQPAGRFIYPDDREEHARLFAALVAGQRADYRIETRYRRLDGRVLWAHLAVSAVREADGTFRHAVAMIEDITARKEAEAALAREHEFLDAVLENLAEGIVACDADGTLTLFNRATREFHGLPAAPLPPEAWAEHYDLFLPDGTTRMRPADIPLHRALRGEHVRDVELVIAPAVGPRRTVLSSGQALRDAAGRPLGAVVAMHDITTRKALEAQLQHQAFHDPLTGLPNRALFMDRLEHALVRARRPGAALAVLFLDLDRFKVVNDSLGHAAGDRLLAAVAGRLRRGARAEDTIARLGGDEFAILLEGIADAGEALRLADRITAALDAPFSLEGHAVAGAASVGIALSTPEHDTAVALLRDAEVAMYRAKRDGATRHAIFDPRMNAAALERLTLEADLRRAVGPGECAEFRLHYQPLVDLATGQIAGFEALVRWQHPARGLVPPGEFIPLAEETGLILPLGRWVLGAACRQARAWRDAGWGHPAPTISVNLSARQFLQPDLAAEVAAALAATGLPPGSLTLEITESVLMAEAEVSHGTLRALQGLGVRLAIDDFGTGYSSLAYLKRFPVDVLKIDRAFVAGLLENPEDAAIVEAVVTLARALGLAVTAEGIEAGQAIARLRSLGCVLGQGYYFSAPLPPEAVAEMLQAGRHSCVARRWSEGPKLVRL